MKLTRSKIREDLLTLEDAALLADPNGQIPQETMERVRRLVRTDPRVALHYEYLEALAAEADIPATCDRLHAGFKCLQDVERLEAAEGWQHPGEILDPTGDIGISYPELVQLAGMRARREGKRGRSRAVERKLERAWSAEKAGDTLAERFAARLCDYQPVDAERLLRQASRRYHARHRRTSEPGVSTSTMSG